MLFLAHDIALYFAFGAVLAGALVAAAACARDAKPPFCTPPPDCLASAAWILDAASPVIGVDGLEGIFLQRHHTVALHLGRLPSTGAIQVQDRYNAALPSVG